MPSVGIRPPGRTRKASPRLISASGTVAPVASSSAVGGERSISARMPAVVPRLARVSNNWPTSTSSTIMPADSKNSSTLPSARRKAAGKIPGAMVATVLTVQATSTPKLIRENIVGRPRRKPAQPPVRIGQPPQKTIGVASSSCNQFPACPPRRAVPQPAWPEA